MINDKLKREFPDLSESFWRKFSGVINKHYISPVEAMTKKVERMKVKAAYWEGKFHAVKLENNALRKKNHNLKMQLATEDPKPKPQNKKP